MSFKDSFIASIATTICPPVGIYLHCKNAKNDIKQLKEKRPDVYNDLKRSAFDGKMESKEGKVYDVAMSIMNPAYGLIRSFSGGGLAELFG